MTHNKNKELSDLTVPDKKGPAGLAAGPSAFQFSFIKKEISR